MLYYLGTEAIRIINDFTIKHKYLKILNEKGDMNSYLINYFVFEKIYYKEIKKNIDVLEKKIKQTEDKFKLNNEKLTAAIRELEKSLQISRIK